ncbi:MAG: HNH endonuclease [Candidatus Omnitrophica bacterium]|nr:HNH endonuclease [Candidatus Omnitrophota bacterium]
MNNFEYTPPKNTPIESDKLLYDLKKVAEKLGTDILSQKLYLEYGKYDVTSFSRRFGTWREALSKVGLKPGNIFNYSDEELFENILNIWQYKGKQPIRKDLNFKPSKISQSPYNRRFKSWSYTLLSFVKYANGTDIQNIETPQISDSIKKINRDPSLRLRFKVLKRDNFSCKQCGVSPAKDKNVELHVDHIKPWSKGGETILENLQTLCQKCNLGKSNIE